MGDHNNVHPDFFTPSGYSRLSRRQLARRGSPGKVPVDRRPRQPDLAIESNLDGAANAASAELMIELNALLEEMIARLGHDISDDLKSRMAERLTPRHGESVRTCLDVAVLIGRLASDSDRVRGARNLVADVVFPAGWEEPRKLADLLGRSIKTAKKLMKKGRP